MCDSSEASSRTSRSGAWTSEPLTRSSGGARRGRPPGAISAKHPKRRPAGTTRASWSSSSRGWRACSPGSGPAPASWTSGAGRAGGLSRWPARFRSPGSRGSTRTARRSGSRRGGTRAETAVFDSSSGAAGHRCGVLALKDKLRLLRQVRRSLARDGVVVVAEGLVAPARRAAEPAAQLVAAMGLDFALQGARFFRRSELDALLADAGFRRVKFHDAGGGLWFVVAGVDPSAFGSERGGAARTPRGDR